MHPLKVRWQRGEATVGAWLSIPEPFAAETMSRIGFDWLCIDMQHGLVDYQRAVIMLQAMTAGTATPIVRVPTNDAALIGRVLDAGAQGVIVPLVNSRREAEAAVAACRYPPSGQRSFGPTRAALVAGPDYFARAGNHALCLLMIETKQALDEVEAIAATPGADGLFVGPNDLSLALGLPPRWEQTDPRFDAAFLRIVAACRGAGIVAGSAGTIADVHKRLAQGFLFVQASGDLAALSRQASADLKRSKEHG
jgi:4-hydroxy-2-oxoheptanedioate aldolase